MSVKYIENQVTHEDIDEIRQESRAAAASQRLQYFYKGNHYSRLYGNQQAGYHWFYLAGPEEQHCTCGLTVAKDQSVEASIGHRNLPSFVGTTWVFVNHCEFDPFLQLYKYGAFCQICGESSLSNLLKKEVRLWIESHENLHLKEKSLGMDLGVKEE